MMRNKRISATNWRQYPVSCLLVTSLLCSTGTLAGPQERQQAKRIHDRLAGTLPTNQMLDDLEQIILTSGTEAAALHVIDNNPAFYNVTLKNFAAPWTNEAQDVFVPLNDYSATVIGMIRDDIDFRRVLFGDHLYVGASGLVGLYTPTNNNHYEALERLGPVAGDLSNNTVLVASSQTSAQTLNLPANATAGVMTTRAAAEAFFSGGTNRAMLRFTFMNHLCTDFEPLKDTSRVPDRVRRDVTRSPGGDSRIYMNNCVACHAGMDGLAGAFAYYEYDITTGELQYSNQVANYNANFDQNGVSLKHNINPNNFKYGFVTTDDSWINYWRHGSNYLLGWDRNNSAPAPQDENFHTYGNGAQSLGRELAHTRAFSTCQVKKVFRAVCLKDADVFAADRLEVNTIADGFEVDGNMKNVFARVAAYCSTAQ